MAEEHEGLAYGCAVPARFGEPGERANILGDDLFAKIRLYGFALPFRGAGIQIAGQRELGEGGGVPGRDRVVLGKLAAYGNGFCIQDGIAHELDVPGGEGLAPFKLRVEYPPHVGADVAELRGLFKGVQKGRDRGPVLFGLGAAGKLVDAVQRRRIANGFTTVLQEKGCGIANCIGAVEELLKGNRHTASYS